MNPQRGSSTIGTVAVCLLAVITLVVVTVGAWQLGWFVEKGPRESRITLPQVEPTGVYTGESTGTYTICVDDGGTPYASYFEGYVQTVTGPAEEKDGKIVLTGEPTGDFTKGE